MFVKHNAWISFAVAAALLGGVGCASTNAPPSDAQQAAESASDAPKKPVVDPEADTLLKQTSDSLASAKQFSVNVEIWADEVVGDGHKLSTTKTMQVQVSRPDQLHIEVQSPKRSRGIWYDGKTVTILDRAKNLYGIVSAPDTIDKMVDAMNDQFGIKIPMEDLLLADPYASAMPLVETGGYFGKAKILGVDCLHLAFSTAAVDWQVWVEAGGQHLPRKLVITYKNEETAPQYTAIFSDWVMNQSIPQNAFTFSPPAGSAKVDVLRQDAQ